MRLKISVVIRAKDEEAMIGEVLTRLESQTLQDFEVILVDNESIDRTVEIFKASKIKSKKIISIPRDEFNYPKACNIGAAESKAPIVLFLSAHSIPIENDMLESAASHFLDKNVVGVYGPCFANAGAGWLESKVYGHNNFHLKTKKIKLNFMGVLGFTNAAIRKDLWSVYPFNEKDFSGGGEDVQWGGHFLKKGYSIIYEPKLGVKHSHGLRAHNFLKQYFTVWVYLWLKASIYNIGEK